LRFKRDADRTVVARLRYTLPLQAQTSVPMPDGSAYLLLLNPTGGILGGDRLLSRIVLDPGTHACLSTPSATRVYRSLGPPSVQETWIDVGAGATLEYMPDHVIPHAESRFKQRLSVELGRGSRAILFDAFAAGRIAHGESWAFREFDSETRVFCSGSPLYLSRTKIMPAPPAFNPTSLGVAVAARRRFRELASRSRCHARDARRDPAYPRRSESSRWRRLRSALPHDQRCRSC
jgi:urease accessory protein